MFIWLLPLLHHIFPDSLSYFPCLADLHPHPLNLDGSASKRVVARQRINRALSSDILGGLGHLELLHAGVAGGAIRANVETASGVLDAVGARAGGNGALEAVLVRPALQVITVEAIARGVAVGPSKAVRVLNRAGVVEELVKDGQDRPGVRLRTYAAVVRSDGWECDLVPGKKAAMVSKWGAAAAKEGEGGLSSC